MRILVTGANGFIGGHIAARLVADGHDLVASARDLKSARRRFPHWRWVEADFRRAPDWSVALQGVDALVNCVGVLQDGGADSAQAAHVEGADALFAACERAGVRRIIHMSAIGADVAAGTEYARTKHDGDARLMARDLDWVIVKPSLVVAKSAYGGTALVRGLAAIPWVTPLIQTPGRFQPIHMRDLCEAVSRLLRPDAPKRVVIEAAGPQSATLEELTNTHRAWLGLPPRRVWRVPDWMAATAFRAGDLLGALGVRSSLRSTARAQMAHNVGGNAADLPKRLGFAAQPYEAALNAEPAGGSERIAARLFFLRPLAHGALAAFWIGTGIVCLTSGRAEAIALAQEAGLGAWAPAAADWGGRFDIAMGAAYLLSPRKKWLLALMAVVTLGYLAALTVLLPDLWADPLGRLMKLIPFFALLALLAATEEPR